MSTPANAIVNDQQLPLFAPPGTQIPKLIHAGTDWVGQPYVFIDDQSAAMYSKLGLGVLVDNVFGIALSGPTSFSESLENIHFGCGYWTLNPVQLSSVGSSAAVPVPTLVNDTPRLLSSAATVSNSVSNLKAADPSFPS